MFMKGQWRLLTILGLLFLTFAGQTIVQAVQGDPRHGESLYVGTTSFSNGGAPCLACHGISGAGLGLAGGANFGPDLTDMFDNFGEEGLVFILDSLASFPSMTPIYAQRPLTSEEQSHVAAFFAEVSGRESFHTETQILGHISIWTLAIIVILLLVGWDRLKGVRRPLVDKARTRKGGLQ